MILCGFCMLKQTHMLIFDLYTEVDFVPFGQSQIVRFNRRWYFLISKQERE